MLNYSVNYSCTRILFCRYIIPSNVFQDFITSHTSHIERGRTDYKQRTLLRLQRLWAMQCKDLFMQLRHMFSSGRTPVLEVWPRWHTVNDVMSNTVTSLHTLRENDHNLPANIKQTRSGRWKKSWISPCFLKEGGDEERDGLVGPCFLNYCVSVLQWVMTCIANVRSEVTLPLFLSHEDVTICDWCPWLDQSL